MSIRRAPLGEQGRWWEARRVVETSVRTLVVLGRLLQVDNDRAQARRPLRSPLVDDLCILDGGVGPRSTQGAAGALSGDLIGVEPTEARAEDKDEVGLLHEERSNTRREPLPGRCMGDCMHGRLWKPRSPARSPSPSTLPRAP